MNKQALGVILKSIDQDNAILVTEMGQEIIWPKASLPSEVNLGERLVLSLSSENEAVALTNLKEFLNSILTINK